MDKLEKKKLFKKFVDIYLGFLGRVFSQLLEQLTNLCSDLAQKRVRVAEVKLTGNRQPDQKK